MSPQGRGSAHGQAEIEVMAEAVKPAARTLVYEVTRPIVALGAFPGDHLVYDPDSADNPVSIVRKFGADAMPALLQFIEDDGYAVPPLPERPRLELI